MNFRRNLKPIHINEFIIPKNVDLKMTKQFWERHGIDRNKRAS